jgi:hypothetical protein
MTNKLVENIPLYSDVRRFRRFSLGGQTSSSFSKFSDITSHRTVWQKPLTLAWWGPNLLTVVSLSLGMMETVHPVGSTHGDFSDLPDGAVGRAMLAFLGLYL